MVGDVGLARERADGGGRERPEEERLGRTFWDRRGLEVSSEPDAMLRGVL